MNIKKLLSALGFKPKDNQVDVFSKTYRQHDNYTINIDFAKGAINYAELCADCKTTQNFSQDENWVVLECVDRLLTKGYKPQNIILEKTWPAGHGTSGRLDICVTRDDGSEYLMIECKTWGKEFEKELNNMYKTGGQLFTYFKFSNKADVIMLYTSRFEKDKIDYRNEIIKIEEDYRTGDVKDFYDKWNKLTKDNGIFESWVEPYCFKNKALTLKQLKPITQDDSSFIFNQFLEILRHNVVSDKGNAFNKIFTLFLCKVYDETSKKDNDELDFQWKEGQDDDVSFQLRLTNLYKKGMDVFLSRIVSDFDEDAFNIRCKDLTSDVREYLLDEMRKVRLEKNNEFAIKEVYDHDSFVENAKIVKEVVELLQGYRIRYNKRQQYLSDFFELLLTTGLKQEAGQFFTPVPVAQFIIKSLPLDDVVDEKLNSTDGNLLPYMIDYAAGSGHFVTEYMHEVQNIINKKELSKYIDKTARKIRNWQDDPYDWATEYVYGVEKDYRLVKVGKVGCYLHGDGLANVILSDGLGNFVNTKDYKGKLHKSNDDNSKDNQRFDIILSNPPYSVSSFKQTTRDYYTEKDFELYKYLTDNSSEIECLFVERAKQLLKDGGLAGIILPSSILTNSGIYTKTRELLLKYFEIIAITELGSNTFMATGTNTVILFLKRRNNYDCINLKKSVDKFFSDLTDVTINGIETPVSKYVNYVWDGLDYDDYLTLLNKTPNNKVKNHDIYKEYFSKIKSKNENEFYKKVLELEKEKIFYFILAYPQKVVTVKTGEKDAEKQFLGYEFSNRRGAEGIHAIQRAKTIDECTKLFDINSFDNPQKASTYIYKAFKNEGIEIDETLKDNISKVDLLDMMTFDRAEFEKTINVKAKKKIKVESKWDITELGNIECLDFEKGKSITKEQTTEGKIPVVAGGTNFAYYHNVPNRSGNVITISASGANSGFVNYWEHPIWASDCSTVITKNANIIKIKYLYNYLKTRQNDIYSLQKGNAQPHVYIEDIKKIKIPLPPLDIQQKIVDEIEEIEKENKKINQKIEFLLSKIQNVLDKNLNKSSNVILSEITTFKRGPFGGSLKKEIFVDKGYKIYEQQHAIKNDFSIGHYYITEQKFNEMKSFELQPDDIIMSCSGTIGRFAIFPKNAEKGIINQALLRLRPIKEKIDVKFLKILLQYITNKFEDNSYGAGLKNVASVAILKEIKVYCPPLSDQQKIVSQIEELEKQIDEAQKIIDNSKQQKQDILNKYL